MGSPGSSLVADIFMKTFGEVATESPNYKPKDWFRYVDDTFIIR